MASKAPGCKYSGFLLLETSFLNFHVMLKEAWAYSSHVDTGTEQVKLCREILSHSRANGSFSERVFCEDDVLDLVVAVLG